MPIIRATTFATGAEPFLYKGGPVGCLLIHGFTGTPHDMRGLGQYLAAQGHTVLGIRLTHHATHPSDMNRSNWHDWYLSALDGWHMLRTECESVFVIGLSAGGVTALLLAAREPVAGVISLSAPMQPLNDWRIAFARLFSTVMPFAPKRGLDKLPAERVYTAYGVWPIGALAELQDFLRNATAVLGDITAPALLMHAADDDVAPPENLDFIYERLGSVHKTKVRLDVAEHVITDGIVRDEVFAQIGAFIAANTTGRLQTEQPDTPPVKSRLSDQ